MADYKFVVKKDAGDEFRWNLVSTANGQTVATSGEGFASKQNCMDSIERVMKCTDAEIEEA